MKNKLQASKLSDYKDEYSTPLIEGFIDAQTLTMVYAKSGVGKSLFTLDLALSVATGGSFLGCKVSNPVPVLYLDGEMNKATVNKRLTLFDADDRVDANYRVNDTDLKYYTGDSDGPVRLSTQENRAGVIEFIKTSQYRFIVLDSLRTLFQVADENASSSVQHVNDFLMSLRHLGCTVVLVHHSNKDGLAYAGSTNIETVLDYAVGITKKGASRQLFVSKNRQDSGISSFDGQYVDFVDAKFVVNATTRLDMQSVCDGLIAVIKRHQIGTIKDVVAYLRGKGLSINSSDGTIPKIYNKYISPYCTDPDFSTLQKFKAALNTARNQDHSFSS